MSWSRGRKPASTGGGCALPGPATLPPTAPNRLYFDNDGLLARHDYDVEISGGTSAAHYVSDYDDVDGIKVPTKHRIFPRTIDGQSLAEPLIVAIDLSEIAFTPSTPTRGDKDEGEGDHSR